MEINLKKLKFADIFIFTFRITAGTTYIHLLGDSRYRKLPQILGYWIANIRTVWPYFSITDEEEDEGGESPRDDVANTMQVLTSKLEDLRTSYDLICKHASALHKSLAELENLDVTSLVGPGGTVSGSGNGEITTKMKTVNERATLFRISSNTMINVSFFFYIFYLNIYPLTVLSPYKKNCFS